jgi:Fe-S cluster biogenesis protein NfuA
MDQEQLIARVQELTGRLEDLEPGDCRELAEELTGAVVQMYGAGLERIVELIEDEETRGRLAADELVAGLLMIHDLYPVPLEERVTQALDSVRPYMESHGGNIELLGFEDGIVKLRLQGSCKSCRASSSTLELAVRQALQEAAPDLLGMDVEGVALAGRQRSPFLAHPGHLPARSPHRHGRRRRVTRRRQRRRNVARLSQ